jgi:5-formyltetrahydrofolate cyclo-ligase
LKLSDEFSAKSPMKSPSDTQVAAAKEELRKQIKLRKSTRTVAETVRSQRWLDEILVLLVQQLKPRVVFAYLSKADEAGTRTVINQLLASDIGVLVPSLVDRTTMVATSFPGWDALRPGALGILVPPSTEACTDKVDLVLVPGLAFSNHGARLGYGAGYYDRWLADHRHAIRVGLCFEYQVSERIPVAPHDQVLDYLVTDRRLIACCP